VYIDLILAYGSPNRNASPSGSRSRTNSAGPNAFSPNGPLIYYPPPRTTWNRIQRVLANTVPELLDTLNSSVDPLTLSEAEGLLGCVLPPSVRDSYLCVDGQDPSSELKEGLFFGLTFLSLEDSLREWTFWRRVESDPTSGNNPDVLVMMSSIPSGWIKSQYACRGWLPLITDRCGNYVGVDLSPGEDGGSWGQVIVFGREFDRKCVLFRGEGEGGWGRWLAGFAEELESGEGWEIDGAKKSGDSGSDDEDDVGYQSYYYDGNGSGGGDSYGEVGSALRLTGEYKGWGVLEAWWDRSVRRWDELGMGLSQAEIRRQQEKIDKRKSARMGGGPGPNELLGLGFGGMRLATAGEDAQVAIPGESRFKLARQTICICSQTVSYSPERSKRLGPINSRSSTVDIAGSTSRFSWTRDGPVDDASVTFAQQARGGEYGDPYDQSKRLEQQFPGLQL
jgi:cell wall assembly regulator SMI1